MHGLWIFLLLPSLATAGGREAATPKATAEPCWFSSGKEGMAEHPKCLRHRADGRPYLDPKLARRLEVDAHGLAAVRSSALGWMYVNRRGEVVVAGVATMDNWADDFQDGRVRIRRGEKGIKWGFADRHGQEVVPPIYDGAFPFEGGRAVVCRGCREVCADPGCEIHRFEGGEWLCIDPQGKPAEGCAPH